MPFVTGALSLALATLSIQASAWTLFLICLSVFALSIYCLWEDTYGPSRNDPR